MANGYFRLDRRGDGTYLEVIPPTDGGAFVDANEVANFLDRYKIEFEKNMLYDTVKNAMTERKTVRITTLSIVSIDESLEVKISPDATTATARFYAPSSGGRDYTKEGIYSDLQKKNVRFGIDENTVNMFLSEKEYCKDYAIAFAAPPEESRDAVIEYHFNTDLSLKPKTNEDGSVDFHQLDNVSLVTKDQVLATLTPAFHGKPGTDVMGRPIQPKKAAVKFLKQSKNAKLAPDGVHLISQCDGHASLVDGQVFVSDTYDVPANVDASTGDIVYNGNVEVKGDVNTGYRIEAKGDVVVNGVVEGATIIADGQIILKCGIQGMGKAVLKAGTNIVTKFIESADVYAGGFIQTESIMHSRVSAGSEIIVKGRKGFITGGSIRSGKYISCKIAGSNMGTQTELEVGTNLALAEEKKKLEEERNSALENIDKAGKVINFISRKIMEHEEMPPEKMQQFHQLSAQKTELEKRVEAIMLRLDEISDQMETSVGGYILVDDIMYPGCKVTISNVTNFIRTETKHGRLVRDGADIRVKGY